VTSKLGTTKEKGSSTTINVKSGRKFILAKSITQAIFGHLRKVNAEMYEYFQSNSDDRDFVERLNIKINIIEYTYAYPRFSGFKRYKTITVNKKRYVQEWKKKGNRYVFSGRYKVKYDSKKKLDKTSKEYQMM